MELRIALCQCDIAWEQPARNLARLEPMVAAAEADVVLLPELFATGFTLDPAGVAEGAGGAVVTALRRWAARYGKAVAGSVAVAENGRFYNRMYFVKPSGEFIGYDKRHLFAPGGEARQYTPGDSRAVVEYGGVRFLLLVCYDLRFPVWSRCRGDYDAILCCASWPAPRREVWRTLLRARAIENQCYAAGVNRVGDDPAARYAGDSALVDFKGRTMRRGTNSDGRVRHGGAGGVPRKIPRVAGCRRIRFKIDVSCARGTPMPVIFPFRRLFPLIYFEFSGI